MSWNSLHHHPLPPISRLPWQEIDHRQHHSRLHPAHSPCGPVRSLCAAPPALHSASLCLLSMLGGCQGAETAFQDWPTLDSQSLLGKAVSGLRCVLWDTILNEGLFTSDRELTADQSQDTTEVQLEEAVCFNWGCLQDKRRLSDQQHHQSPLQHVVSSAKADTQSTLHSLPAAPQGQSGLLGWLVGLFVCLFWHLWASSRQLCWFLTFLGSSACLSAIVNCI